MTEDLLADLVRVATLVLGAGTVAVAAVVVVGYTTAFLRHRAKVRSGSTPRWRGLLPRHVVTVGVSYIIMLVVSAGEVISRFHEDFSWRSPVYFVAYAFGLWSMWDLLGHQRHRKVSLTAPDPEEPWESEGFDTER